MKDLISTLRPNDEHERCGLVINGKIIEVANTHPEPDKGFRMDPKILVKKIEKAEATWHTHPKSDPVLSEEDYAGFTQWPKLVHHIIGVRDGKVEVESYKVDNGLVMKL